MADLSKFPVEGSFFSFIKQLDSMLAFSSIIFNSFYSIVYIVLGAVFLFHFISFLRWFEMFSLIY